MKVPTLYYHLDKLKDGGYVAATVDKDGTYPEKTVYSITEKGEDYFFKLLKKMQAEIFEITLPLDTASFRKNRMDAHEYDRIIKNAKQEIESKLKMTILHKEKTVSIISEAYKENVEAIFDHHIYHLQAELKWLNEQDDLD